MGTNNYEDELRRAEEHERELQRRMNMDDGAHSVRSGGFNNASTGFNNNDFNDSRIPNGQFANQTAYRAGFSAYAPGGNPVRYVFTPRSNPRNTARVFTVISVFFIIIALIFGAIMIFVTTAINKSYDRCTAQTQGVVVNNVLSNSGSKKSSTTYHAVFEYTVNGKTYTQKDPIGYRPAKYKVGETVSVNYNPGDPDEFYIEKTLWIFYLTFGIIAGFFGLLGIVFVILRAKVNRKAQSMMQ